MQQRQLGKKGPMISPIGIGAMSFTNFYGKTDEAKSHAILAAALDEGVTHIDTSNVYGPHVSEAVIGTFLAKQGGAASDLFSIATKAGISRDKDTGARTYDNSAAYLEAELDGSLSRMGVDCVDLFYIHRRDPDMPIEEVAETLAGFIKKGKIRSFGFSEIAPSSLRRANAVHHVAAVQSEYSLAVRYPELGLVQSTRGTTAAALAIAWLLHQDDHIIPIPGTRSTEHLREHCAGARLSLDADTLAAIDKALPVGWAHGDRYSTDQWHGPEKYC